MLETVEAPRDSLDLRSLNESRLLGTLSKLVLRLTSFSAPDRPRLVWRAVATLSSHLDEESLAAFAKAAGWAKDSALLAEVWSFLSVFQTLSTRSLQTLATATRFAEAPSVLEQIVDWLIVHDPALDTPAVGALATACGKLDRADLLERVWRFRGSQPGDFGSFAHAWLSLDLPHRVKEVWDAFKDECRVDPKSAESRSWLLMLGGFTTAATRSSELPIKDVWCLGRSFASVLDNRTLCAFVAAAARVDDRELISEITGTLMPRLSDVRVLQSSDLAGLSAIATAANTVGSARLLEAVWQSVRTQQTRPGPTLWTSLVQAAADLKQSEMLVEMWTTLKQHGGLKVVEACAFADAASQLGNANLAHEIWGAALNISTSRQSKIIGRLVRGVGHSGNAAMLRRFWEGLSDVDVLDPPAWSLLATSAGFTRDRELLADIFDGWPDARRDFRSGSHAVWSSFLGAALRIGEDALFMRMFKMLETGFDPTRWPTRGTAQRTCWTATSILQRSDASFVTETLIGLRLNVDATLDVLRSENPGGRFDGAARCLMKWLINSFFNRPVAEYRTNLQRLVTGLISLERYRTEAWAAVFCRGKEAFVGGLTMRHLAPLESLVTQTADVSDVEELVRLLRGRQAIGLFARFIGSSATQVAPERWEPPEGSRAAALRPLVDSYVSNHVEYLSAGRNQGRLKTDVHKNDYFSSVRQHVEEAGVDTLSADDWQDVLHWTITATAAAAWSTIDRSRWEASMHQSKNQLRHGLEELQQPSRPGSASQVALSIRRLLRGMWFALNQRESGPAQTINLASLIRGRWKGLSRSLPRTETEIPTSLRIAAWEGAKRSVVEPLILEIRQNANRALALLPEDRRYLRVTATDGIDDDRGFAVLTVSNSFLPGAAHDPYSTGRGVRIVQRLSNMLVSGHRVGFAIANPNDRLRGEAAFTWRICLPLPDEESAAARSPA